MLLTFANGHQIRSSYDDNFAVGRDGLPDRSRRVEDPERRPSRSCCARRVPTHLETAKYIGLRGPLYAARRSLVASGARSTRRASRRSQDAEVAEATRACRPVADRVGLVVAMDGDATVRKRGHDPVRQVLRSGLFVGRRRRRLRSFSERTIADPASSCAFRQLEDGRGNLIAAERPVPVGTALRGRGIEPGTDGRDPRAVVGLENDGVPEPPGAPALRLAGGAVERPAGVVDLQLQVLFSHPCASDSASSASTMGQELRVGPLAEHNGRVLVPPHRIHMAKDLAIAVD